MKIGNYVKFGFGNTCCHIDAVHATSPKADRYTEEIAAGIMAQTGCAVIIGIVSRTIADLNRPPGQGNDEAVWEYRDVIKQFLYNKGLLVPSGRQLARPYLHIGLHGMKDEHYGPLSLEVGTIHGQTCSGKVRQWFGKALKTKVRQAFPEANVVFDQHWIGNRSLAAHRWGEGRRYPGYGKNYNAFQLEISRTLREYHRQTIIDILAAMIAEFGVTFSRR